MKFSKNGKFLASAGQDAAVRVWEVWRRACIGTTPRNCYTQSSLIRTHAHHGMHGEG